jgi:hypothetical protein
MGVMFIELFTKFLTEMDKLEVLTNLSKDGLPDDWVGDSEGTRGLVERMVASEPAYRPSTVEILVMVCWCFLMVLVLRNSLVIMSYLCAGLYSAPVLRLWEMKPNILLWTLRKP